MRFTLRTLALLAILSSFALGGAVLAAQKPALLGSFGDWHVYTAGAGANRLCYALAEPQQSIPTNANRGEVQFLISTWPGRKVRNEASVIPGYLYPPGAVARLEVGSDKFEFFTKNNAGTGGAWLEDPAVEKRLIDSLKRGAQMSVTGTSVRGTLTRDNYSLTGISAALDKIAASCK